MDSLSDNKEKVNNLCNENDNHEEEDICELEHLRKLFIGGLAAYTTEDSLKAFYGQWGKVVDVVVMRDSTTKRSRGFGFITYTKAYMVDKAQENRPHTIDGKTVEAKRALPRPERESRETSISVKKLFVGGLKDNHDDECLKEYFSQFGNVISIKILTDKTTGKRRGFAFIEFDDYDAVDKAVLQKSHSIKYVVVDVKKSIYNQDQQRQQNNTQMNNNNQNPAKKMQPQQQYGGYPAPQMPPYQQPPMNGPPPQPYNYWGPPPQVPQPYYQQGPPPQMNGWNYPPAPNGWNAGPPAAVPPVGPNWQQNQWTGPPPVGPPANNWNAPAVPVPAPNGPNSTNTPVQPPQQQQQQPQPPNNFGTGYQQNYGGGPTKHNNTNNSNRMNPYNQQQKNNYGNNMQASGAGYGSNYGQTNNGKSNGPLPPANNSQGPAQGPNGLVQNKPNTNKFRR